MPKPDPLYALEKLGQAVYELATGAGRIQERLYEAAIYTHRIRPENFVDEDMRRVFAGIKDDLTFDESKGAEGRLIGTLRKTSDADACGIAARIFDLYVRLRRQVDSEDYSKPE